MPRLTVIMPVRNGEAHLDAAISSTLRALPKDSEVAILDDGSDDRTAEILDGWRKEPRILVLSHSVAGGVAAGLNSLLAATDSEFVARMDADDVCFPWRFRSQMRRMAYVDFSFGNVVRIDSRGKPMLRIPNPMPVPPHVMDATLALGNVLVHPTMMARRSSIDALGGYRSMPSEDYDMWLRAVSSGQMLEKRSEFVLGYRTHSSQITADDRWKSRSVDPLLLSSYAELVRVKFGLNVELTLPDRWSSAGLMRTMSDADFTAFSQRFIAHEDEVPILSRLALRSRRKKRFAQVS